MKKLLSLMMFFAVIFTALNLTSFSAFADSAEHKERFLAYLESEFSFDSETESFYYNEEASWSAPSENNEKPDWILIRAAIRERKTDRAVYGVFGDVVLRETAERAPFSLGWGVYVPKEDRFVDLIDAWKDQNEYPTLFKTVRGALLSDAAMLGDADFSGTVTILDVTEIQRALADLKKFRQADTVDGVFEALYGYAAFVSDFDGDGKRTVMDATKIQRMLADLEDYNGTRYLTSKGYADLSVDISDYEPIGYTVEKNEVAPKNSLLSDHSISALITSRAQYLDFVGVEDERFDDAFFSENVLMVSFIRVKNEAAKANVVMVSNPVKTYPSTTSPDDPPTTRGALTVACDIENNEAAEDGCDDPLNLYISVKKADLKRVDGISLYTKWRDENAYLIDEDYTTAEVPWDARQLDYTIIPTGSYFSYDHYFSGECDAVALVRTKEEFKALFGEYDEKYGDAFFKENALVIAFVEMNAHESHATVSGIRKKNGTLFVSAYGWYDDLEFYSPTEPVWQVYCKVKQSDVADITALKATHEKFS